MKKFFNLSFTLKCAALAVAFAAVVAGAAFSASAIAAKGAVVPASLGVTALYRVRLNDTQAKNAADCIAEITASEYVKSAYYANDYIGSANGKKVFTYGGGFSSSAFYHLKKGLFIEDADTSSAVPVLASGDDYDIGDKLSVTLKFGADTRTVDCYVCGITIAPIMSTAPKMSLNRAEEIEDSALLIKDGYSYFDAQKLAENLQLNRCWNIDIKFLDKVSIAFLNTLKEKYSISQELVNFEPYVISAFYTPVKSLSGLLYAVAALAAIGIAAVIFFAFMKEFDKKSILKTAFASGLCLVLGVVVSLVLGKIGFGGGTAVLSYSFGLNAALPAVILSVAAPVAAFGISVFIAFLKSKIEKNKIKPSETGEEEFD